MTIILHKNSFITLDEADIYFDDRFDSEKWYELDAEEKEKLLISASKKINAFDYVGIKEDEAQNLEFPRNYGTPQDIKDAVCEEAFSMSQKSKDMHKLNQDANITSISLGAGSVSYNLPPKDESSLLVSCAALYLVRRWTKKGFNLGC